MPYHKQSGKQTPWHHGSERVKLQELTTRKYRHTTVLRGPFSRRIDTGSASQSVVTLSLSLSLFGVQRLQSVSLSPFLFSAPFKNVNVPVTIAYI